MRTTVLVMVLTTEETEGRVGVDKMGASRCPVSNLTARYMSFLVPDKNSENTGHINVRVYHAFFGRQVFMQRFRYFVPFRNLQRSVHSRHKV
jgi:hypothetical protein